MKYIMNVDKPCTCEIKWGNGQRIIIRNFQINTSVDVQKK